MLKKRFSFILLIFNLDNNILMVIFIQMHSEISQLYTALHESELH